MGSGMRETANDDCRKKKKEEHDWVRSWFEQATIKEIFECVVLFTLCLCVTPW
jgi:hypothetical protein